MDHARSDAVAARDTDVLGRRAVAFLVDSVVISVLFVAILFLGTVISGIVIDLTTGGLGGIVFLLFVLLAVVVSVGYKIYLDAEGGQTYGKRLMNIEVIMEDGSECTWGASYGRNFVLGIEGLLGGLVILVTEKDQRLGDLAVDTLVVAT
ncbi:RDD family protein [Haloarchaeobius baliensis]|uniref:RDD family protein n=1 Tax=Haloarchaeobius baliensis TaxID=1670458 RepID=UPI003F883ABE